MLRQANRQRKKQQVKQRVKNQRGSRLTEYIVGDYSREPQPVKKNVGLTVADVYTSSHSQQKEIQDECSWRNPSDFQ